VVFGAVVGLGVSWTPHSQAEDGLLLGVAYPQLHTKGIPLIRALWSTQNSKNKIRPKAYPEEMEVIRTLYANTSFGTLFPFARGFSLCFPPVGFPSLLRSPSDSFQKPGPMDVVKEAVVQGNVVAVKRWLSTTKNGLTAVCPGVRLKVRKSDGGEDGRGWEHGSALRLLREPGGNCRAPLEEECFA
jgi:hypothetical protein